MQLAALIVDRDPAAGDDLHSVVGFEAQQAGLHSKHDHPQQGIAIFQSKVEVPGFGAAEIRNLSFDPDVGIAALHRSADGPNQVGNMPNTPRRRLSAKSKTELVFQGHQPQFICKLNNWVIEELGNLVNG